MRGAAIVPISPYLCHFGPVNGSVLQAELRGAIMLKRCGMGIVFCQEGGIATPLLARFICHPGRIQAGAFRPSEMEGARRGRTSCPGASF
jgi:hypothetical protein